MSAESSAVRRGLSAHGNFTWLGGWSTGESGDAPAAPLSRSSGHRNPPPPPPLTAGPATAAPFPCACAALSSRSDLELDIKVGEALARVMSLDSPGKPLKVSTILTSGREADRRRAGVAPSSNCRLRRPG